MNKNRSVFLSAVLGNVLEYYDFTVYAVFVVAIGKAFFPGDSDNIQLLSSLAVFAAGFATRPLGGVIFGLIGDKFGRRVSLIISMLGMTIPTFIIGLVPDYNAIGYAAPISLILMRLVQGLCISGEGTGAAIFILEHRGNLRPGFTASLVHSSGIMGTLIASLVGVALNQIFPQDPEIWRLAFLLGGFVGLIGFYFRLQVAETPVFLELTEHKKVLKAPFVHVVKRSWRVMIVVAAMGGFTSSVVYLIKSYVKVFYVDVIGVSETASSLLLAYSSVVLMLSMPLFGHLSDLIGRFRTVKIATIAILSSCCPVFYLMSTDNLWVQLLALTLLSTLAGSISGTAYVFVISLFSPKERFSGVGFSYNLGVAIFGGTSALIAKQLVSLTGLHYAPAFYIITMACLFMAVISCFKPAIEAALARNLQVK